MIFFQVDGIFDFQQLFVFISHRVLAQERDYKMHHVCACVGVCVYALVCHADFSKTTTATDFLSINCPNEFLCP